MRTALLITTFIIATGCAGPRPPTTVQFYEQEAQTTNMCMAAANKLPLAQRMTIDPSTGRSPYTNAAVCYSSQIRSVVSTMRYQNAAHVFAFADYLVDLTEARDKGIIDNATFIASYRQMVPLFKKSIESADQQRGAAERRELADRLAVFGIAMASVAAEQERQRQANRPVTCVLTGIYRTTGVTCL